MINAERQQSLTADPKARITLGVLTSGLDQYQTDILRGAVAAAKERDVDLIVFNGGELDSPVLDRANGNVLYELARQSTADAMILFTGTLMSFVDLERQIEFSAQYKVPKVSIGVSLPNAYNVLLDNDFGMRMAMKHLIEVHGYRRIAFIQGPQNNEEATLRFKAYINALKEYAIPYNPQLVVPGRFLPEDGEKAIRILLDERKLSLDSIDAILGANDNMAIGALTELQRRNISVPGQIAVVGFDNTEEAEATIPPLTTIRQPLHEQGKCGVELALTLLSNERVLNPLMLRPELVVRRSCGCFSRSMIEVQPEVALLDKATVQAQLAAAKDDITAAMFSAFPGSDNFRRIETLYDAFLNDLVGDDQAEHTIQFILALNDITHELLVAQTPIQGWHEILTVMRRESIPLLGGDIQLHTHAEDLWQRARIVISEAIQHAESNKQRHAKLQAHALNAIGEPLLISATSGDLEKIMLDSLPVLDVKSCYLALYEDLSREWVSIMFSYDQGNDATGPTIKPGPIRFLAKDLAPQNLLPTDRRYTLLVKALHFGNTQLGILVLEVDQPQAYIYETLRKQMSRVLNTAFMMRQLEEKHTLLESAMEGLKTTQTMLVHSEKMNALGQMVAGVAHEINNPIAFVNSNVHSLGSTFEELVSAYSYLEDYARTIAQEDNSAELSKIRQEAEVDFLVEDTQDLIGQTLNGLKRVKDIVTELRKFSRLDEAEFKVSNLRENIESTLLIASGELRNRIDVELDIDPALTFVCAPAELNQVFLNIIVNGAQAIEGKGTISIAGHEVDGMVVIELSDTGGGIPDHVIGHIFDPFFTTKPIGVGTGLGLAIVHKIVVDSHKGSINVESQPGVGTKFTIRIPKELQQ